MRGAVSLSRRLEPRLEPAPRPAGRGYPGWNSPCSRSSCFFPLIFGSADPHFLYTSASAVPAPRCCALAHGENGPPHKVAGVSGWGRPKPWSEVTALAQLGKKPAAAARTLRTNGTIANGAELQKFDRNQKSDVFLIETAEANVRTLLTQWGTPSSHRHVWLFYR